MKNEDYDDGQCHVDHKEQITEEVKTWQKGDPIMYLHVNPRTEHTTLVSCMNKLDCLQAIVRLMNQTGLGIHELALAKSMFEKFGDSKQEARDSRGADDFVKDIKDILKKNKPFDN